MTIKDLKDVIDELTSQGFEDLMVVYRDNETDPDIDVDSAYLDEEAERMVIHGF